MELKLNPISLAIAAHPASHVAVVRPVQAGGTLAQTLADANVAGDGWVVTVGDSQVPYAMWHKVRVKPGQSIRAQAIPHKQAVALAAIVALSYFTFGAGGLALGAAAGGAAGTTAGIFAVGGAIGGGFWAAAAVYIGGSLLINALLAPKATSASSADAANPTYSLSGGRNQDRKYGFLALVLGETKMVPDLAAQQYAEFRGEDQYLSSIFHAGINCGAVNDIKFGTTLLTSYDGVKVSKAGFAGAADDPIPALSIDTIAGGLLDNPSTDSTTPGPFVQRTSSADTIRLAVDIEAQLVYADGGGYRAAVMDLHAEYAPAGTGRWMPFVGDSAVVRLTNATTKPLRVSWVRDVPAGRYDVRVRKNSPNPKEAAESKVASWTSLRSSRQQTADYSGQPRVRIEIKASGQLNGSLDEISWIARAAPIQMWDGSRWFTATEPGKWGTSNPGAIGLMLMRGLYRSDGRRIAGLGFDDSRLDLDSWTGFMLRCAQMDFRFDAVIQENMSAGDLIDTVLDAGWGRLTRGRSGKYGVSWLAEDQPIEGVLNMAAIKARSFSVDYNLTPGADELTYEIFDRDNDWYWQPVRVKSPTTVGVPQNTASMAVLGITRQAQAAQRARLTMAQNAYGRKSISFDIDLEYLDYQAGSVLAISHDLTQWGYGGRLRHISVGAGSFTVSVDEPVPTTAASTRGLGLRLPGERQMRVWRVASVSVDGRQITVADDWPGIRAGTSAEDVLWMFDFKAVPGQRVRVASIKPLGRMEGATITCVPEDPVFWDFVLKGPWTPPPNNSLLAAPSVVEGSLLVTEGLVRDGLGFGVELTASFRVRGRFDHAEVWVTYNGFPAVQAAASVYGTQVTWRSPGTGTAVVEVRSFDALGRMGGRATVTHQIVGMSALPEDVQSFSITNGVFVWSAVSDLDLVGYVIRYQFGNNRTWSNANPLHGGTVSGTSYLPETPVPGPCTYLIKAMDALGQESVNAAFILANLGDVIVDNVILEYDAAAAGFPGAKDGCSVIGGRLLANDTGGLFWLDEDAPHWGLNAAPYWAVQSYSAMVYEISYVTHAEEAGSRLTLDLVVGVAADDALFWPGDGLPHFAGDAGGYWVAPVSYLVEFRYGTQGVYWGADVAGYWPSEDQDAVWASPTAWQPWPGYIDDIGQASLDFRISIEGSNRQAGVYALAINFDVPDENESFNDIEVTAAGKRLPLTKAYRAIKNVQLTLQDRSGNTAVNTICADKALIGPLIYCYDAAGVRTAGLIDARIQGVKSNGITSV